MTLLEPWVLICLVSGAVATLLFAHGALVGARVLRYARVEAMKDLAKQRVAAIDVELKAVQAELSALPSEPEALLADLAAGDQQHFVCAIECRDQGLRFVVVRLAHRNLQICRLLWGPDRGDDLFGRKLFQ